MGVSDQHAAHSGAGGVGRQRGSEEEVVEDDRTVVD